MGFSEKINTCSNFYKLFSFLNMDCLGQEIKNLHTTISYCRKTVLSHDFGNVTLNLNYMEYLTVNRPQIFQSTQTHWHRMSNLKIIILASHFSCLVLLLNLLEIFKSLACTSCALPDPVKHCNFSILCTAASAVRIISVHKMKINSKVISLLLMLFKESLHKIAMRGYIQHILLQRVEIMPHTLENSPFSRD